MCQAAALRVANICGSDAVATDTYTMSQEYELVSVPAHLELLVMCKGPDISDLGTLDFVEMTLCVINIPGEAGRHSTEIRAHAPCWEIVRHSIDHNKTYLLEVGLCVATRTIDIHECVKL